MHINHSVRSHIMHCDNAYLRVTLIVTNVLEEGIYEKAYKINL
jgi:hypothetical protein